MLGVYDGYNIEEEDDPRTFFGSPSLEAEMNGPWITDVIDDPEPLGQNSTEYWECALNLIYAWGEYLGKKKLYINATHPETAHRVQTVVDNSFNGSTRRLKDRENETSRIVDEKLAKFEEECTDFGVETVSRHWLYEHLKDGNDTKSIRGKITSRKNSAKPAESLKNLI